MQPIHIITPHTPWGTNKTKDQELRERQDQEELIARLIYEARFREEASDSATGASPSVAAGVPLSVVLAGINPQTTTETTTPPPPTSTSSSTTVPPPMEVVVEHTESVITKSKVSPLKKGKKTMWE